MHTAENKRHLHVDYYSVPERSNLYRSHISHTPPAQDLKISWISKLQTPESNLIPTIIQFHFQDQNDVFQREEQKTLGESADKPLFHSSSVAEQFKIHLLNLMPLSW